MFHNHHGQLVPGVRCATLDHGSADLPRAPRDLSAWAPPDKAVIDVLNAAYLDDGAIALLKAPLTDTRLTGISPNPFNPLTEISFYLEKAGAVKVSVYDLAGRQVRTIVDSSMGVGEHTVTFDGTGLPSAVYFVLLDTGEVRSTQRMLLVK